MAQEASMNYSSVTEGASLRFLCSSQQVCACEAPRTAAPVLPVRGGGRTELWGGPGKPRRAGARK